MAKTARDEGADEIADWAETLGKAKRSQAKRSQAKRSQANGFQKALDRRQAYWPFGIGYMVAVRRRLHH